MHLSLCRADMRMAIIDLRRACTSLRYLAMRQTNLATLCLHLVSRGPESLGGRSRGQANHLVAGLTNTLGSLRVLLVVVWLSVFVELRGPMQYGGSWRWRRV